MNTTEQNDLISERDLRMALRPLRPDPVAFEEAVRQQVESQKNVLGKNATETTSLDQSEWVRVAASLIPIPLLGKSASTSLSIASLGKLSIGKQIVAYAALPATGLLLIFVTTVWSFFKIRAVNRNGKSGEADVQKSMAIISRWSFLPLTGCLAFVLVSMILLYFGFVIPVFAFFLLSVVAMVTMITRLGHEGMVDRGTVGAILGSWMMTLGQLAMQLALNRSGTHLLDQNLIQAVLFGGAAVILFITIQTKYMGCYFINLTAAIAVLPILGFSAFFTISLWHPIATDEMKSVVESFEKARFSSANWRIWKIPAVWLLDSDVTLNLAKPRKLLESELAKEEPDPIILRYAFETGLLTPEDMHRLPNLNDQKRFLLSERSRQTSLTSIGLAFWIVHALLMRGELSEDERDLLSDRLAVSIEDLKTRPFGSIIKGQLDITMLARLIDRPLDIDRYRTCVHQTLVESQRLTPRFSTRSGGFSEYDSINFSNERGTANAIDLMQIYGVPPDVRINALRSYLRPTAFDIAPSMIENACMRTASLHRLESLPEVPPLTWYDYVQHEQNLLMSIVFVSLCIFATLSAPKLPNPNDS